MSSCDLALLRLDGEQQTPVDDLDMPQYACNKDTRNGPQLNGQSMQRIYKIERVDLPR